MNAKHRLSISNENLAFEWRCAVSVQYTPDFEDLAQKRKRMWNISLISF